nr:hypothetical protein [Tanacetum cinerariifolium]
MVAYLTKSDASKGFNQVVDFLNGSYIKYALTGNPNIYVSCIKQFWNTVAIKQARPQPQPQQVFDFSMSLLHEALDACATLTRRVEHLKHDKVAQALEITKLKRRVKKLKKGNKVRGLKLRWLKKVGTSQRIDTSDDTVMDDKSNQGRIIDEMDKDDVVALMDDKEEDKKDEEDTIAKVDDSDQV